MAVARYKWLRHIKNLHFKRSLSHNNDTVQRESQNALHTRPDWIHRVLGGHTGEPSPANCGKIKVVECLILVPDILLHKASNGINWGGIIIKNYIPKGVFVSSISTYTKWDIYRKFYSWLEHHDLFLNLTYGQGLGQTPKFKKITFFDPFPTSRLLN